MKKLSIVIIIIFGTFTLHSVAGEKGGNHGELSAELILRDFSETRMCPIKDREVACEIVNASSEGSDLEHDFIKECCQDPEEN